MASHNPHPPYKMRDQDAYTSFIDGYLFYFPNQYEYEMLNLHTKGWINGKNNIELQKINDRDLKLINFATQRSKYNFYNVDSQFDVTVIDKTTKRLLLVPLKTPQKLYDIAWITALNAGLLNQNESKLPKNLKYQTVF
uniref:Uncharacterized protein n=1 Tax=Panagrolaimus superbus TaxID=310955 RepID=A0A914YUU9_9BILA